MRIIDIVNGPWAITPTMLQEIQRIYASHLHRSEKIDLAAIEAATGKKLGNAQSGSYVVDGVCIIPIHGVIGKRMNLLTNISGGASTEAIANDYLTALNDPAVKGIVLHIDSPGGTVDGTKILGDLIAQNRGAKPCIALADGMMCSAAYWIGSAADSINMTDLTTDVGSIGVVAAHMDISGWEEKQGIKTTEITAGQYKRAISQYAPLSEEGRAMIQADLDQIYSLFVDDVAANRGTTVDDVIANMAEGRVFLGQKALDNGLVDSVATLAETVKQVADLAAGKTAANIKRASAARIETKKETSTMSKENCKSCGCNGCAADSCDKCDQKPMDSAAIAAAIASARAEGAQAERDRIISVRAQSIPGHEALIEQLAMDGHSTAADAALAIVAAERTQGAAAAAALDTEANQPAAAAAGEEAAVSTMKRADFNNLSQEDRRKAIKAGTKIVD